MYVQIAVHEIVVIVVSDLIRRVRGLDGERTDAQACLIVTVLIFGGVIAAIVEWVKDLRVYCRSWGVELSSGRGILDTN